jgi:hypothetical protein
MTEVGGQPVDDFGLGIADCGLRNLEIWDVRYEIGDLRVLLNQFSQPVFPHRTSHILSSSAHFRHFRHFNHFPPYPFPF